MVMASKCEEDPRLLFQQLALKIQQKGIGGKHLTDLPSIQTILKANDERSNKSFMNSTKNRGSSTKMNTSWTNLRVGVTVGVGAFAVLLAVIFRWELHTNRGFASFWLKWKKRDLFAEQCAIDVPNVFQDIFRPPVECSMCESVFKVDRIAKITPDEFKTRYAYTGRPVVITDATSNWSAIDNFSFDFFKDLYGDESPALENFRYSCQFFPYQTEFHSLREVFNMSYERSRLMDGSKPWYVGWSNCDSSVTNVLRKYYQRPYFLPTDAESSKTDWIFMGSPGYGAHMHIDHVGHPSWQGQIAGQKKWTLVPPPECAYHCQKVEVTVEPGEIIVLDTNAWFHQTSIVGDEMSITIGSEYD